MPLATDGLLLDQLSADPGSPQEGQAWYNSTSFLFKVYRNGATTNLIDQVAFNAHANSTSNPHSTTLEQARTAGATLAGDINMGGFKLTNVGAGTSGTDGAQRQWVTDQINSKIRGLDWQNSVLSSITTPPGSPVTGDRYRIIATATGAWLGKENQIAEWDGAAWVYTVPNEGFCLRDETTNNLLIFDGTSWGNFGSAISHSTLTNLTADDHTQYLLVNGTRAMTGALNMGTFAITNVGTVNGVTVSAHASRHNPGGADALATAAPGATSVATAPSAGTALSFARSDHVHQSNTTPSNVDKSTAAIGTSGEPARADHKHDITTATAVSLTDATNAEGTGSALARADHTHAHGNRGGGTLHALVSSTANGFQPQSNYAAIVNPTVNNDGTQGYLPGSTWINTVAQTEYVCISNATAAAVWKEVTNSASILTTKSGRVLAASFAGNPKKATVTFTTAFASANYAVVLTPNITVSGTDYTPNVESQVAGSFVINMGTNAIPSLVAVNWVAIINGESA